MKVVFRTYTKKDGSPENGYWAVLQHLETLKDKDIIVRIDIDKKNLLALEEVDIFCPGLKISHLELKKLKDNKFEATFDTKNIREVFRVLLKMGEAGNCGHSYELLIDNKSFYIDGDGSDHLVSINGVELNEITKMGERDFLSNFCQDYQKQVSLNESQLRKIVQETLIKMFKK